MDINKKKALEYFYQQAIRFLSYRARSEKEIRDFLTKKSKNKFLQLTSLSSKEYIENIIQRLKKENLINDNEFADTWIEQRLNFNPKGKNVLRLELLQKGIDGQLVEEKINTISSQNFEKAAKEILRRKIKLYSHFKKRELKDKLIKHLLRRGFDYQSIKVLVDEFLEKS